MINQEFTHPYWLIIRFKIQEKNSNLNIESSKLYCIIKELCESSTMINRFLVETMALFVFVFVIMFK